MERILVFGDIHGFWDKFMSVWYQVQFNPQKDMLIFLGDYIDRGKDGAKVLEFVKEKSALPNVIALGGNHEQMMMSYFSRHSIEEDVVNDLWIHNGGETTLRQLKEYNQYDSEEVSELLKWVNTLPFAYELDNFFFCHAGVNPRIPLNKQTDKDLLWIRNDFFQNYRGEKTIVVGHTPIQYLVDMSTFGEPRPIHFDNNIFACDTGSFLPNGVISCIDLLSKKYWSSKI